MVRQLDGCGIWRGHIPDIGQLGHGAGDTRAETGVQCRHGHARAGLSVRIAKEPEDIAGGL